MNLFNVLYHLYNPKHFLKVSCARGTLVITMVGHGAYEVATVTPFVFSEGEMISFCGPIYNIIKGTS
jgi:hypothetical protein